MDFEHALELVNAAFAASLGRHLSDVEVAIFKGAWQNLTYEKIADEAGYSVRYIKGDVGARFWKQLSQALGESVSKTNFRAALERYGIQLAAHRELNSVIRSESCQESRQESRQELSQELSQESSQSLSDELNQISENPLNLSAERNDEKPYSEPVPLPTPIAPLQTDWDEAIDVSLFYGRTAELNRLRQWVLDDGCRLIALLGMGGIGKTALSVKLAQQLVENHSSASSSSSPFQYIIWRSLRNAPPLENVLSDLIFFLSDQRDTEVRISRLMYWLRTARCLVILDNVETILQPGDRAGQYRLGYENYGELLRVIGETQHQSCVILTSREKPTEIAMLEGVDLWVRSLQLSGSEETALAVIDANHLLGSPEQKHRLGQTYGYNPLALKIVSTSIRELFDGDVSEFLATNVAIFSGIRRLLVQQFDRLSPLEQSVMYWLAVNRQWTSIAELADDMFPIVSRPELLEALESLNWRSLIEKVKPNSTHNRVPIAERKFSQYTQQSVVMEYVTERFVEKICTEIIGDDGAEQDKQNTTTIHNIDIKNTNQTNTTYQTIDNPIQEPFLAAVLPPLPTLPLLQTHALLKTTVNDSVRESQTRFVLEPIAHQLRDSFNSDLVIDTRLRFMLDRLREEQPSTAGYAAGNILNLCRVLQLNVTGYDLSHLPVWHAYLQTMNLHQVDFTDSDLSKSVFIQTFGYVLSVAISPDGQRLATGDGNGQVRLWRTSDGQPLAILQDGATSWVWSVAFSPDGQRLASGSVDQTVKLWNLQTGQHIRTLHGHENWVRSVAFSPDGQRLASGSTDRTVRIWDSQTGACLSVLSEGEDAVWSVAWSPDGRCLATGNNNHTVKLWDVSTGTCLHHFEGHTNWVRSVAFSPDGCWLASGADDGTVRLWNVQTRECVNVLQGHGNAVWSVAWSPDGQTIASASHDQTIRVWHVYNHPTHNEQAQTGQAQTGQAQTGQAHNGQAHNGQCIKRLQAHTSWVWGVAWAADGQRLVSVAHDRTIKLWDTQTWNCLRTVRGYTSVAMCIAWSPDGKTLAGSYDDHAVRLWDISIRTLMETSTGISTGICKRTLHGHTQVVWGVAWHPKGHILASSCDDYTVRLWNVDTGDCLKLFRHKNWVWSVAWSPNGQFLATGTQTYDIYVWDVQTSRCLTVLQGHQDSIWSVIWSPDGETIASGCDDHTVRLWNPKTEICFNVLEHDQSVRRIAFSPDSKRLVSSSADPIVRIWDVQTGTCVQTLEGHERSLWCVAWSPDGRMVASGGDDQTVRIWDVQTGTCLHVLEVHTSQIWSIAFSPDGQTLASSSADQTILLWRVSTGECIQTLRTMRPYEGMIVTGVQGITPAQQATLKDLGAVSTV